MLHFIGWHSSPDAYMSCLMREDLGWCSLPLADISWTMHVGYDWRFSSRYARVMVVACKPLLMLYTIGWCRLDDAGSYLSKNRRLSWSDQERPTLLAWCAHAILDPRWPWLMHPTFGRNRLDDPCRSWSLSHKPCLMHAGLGSCFNPLVDLSFMMCAGNGRCCRVDTYIFIHWLVCLGRCVQDTIDVTQPMRSYHDWSCTIDVHKI